MKEIIIIVDGMMCANCKATVENTLKNINGVKKYSVNLATKHANIVFDESKSNLDFIFKSIEDEGYKVYKLDAKEEYDLISKNNAIKNKHNIIFIGIFATLEFVIAMAHMFNIPLIHQYYFIYVFIQLILTSLVIIKSLGLFKKGLFNLFRTHPSMESLVSIGCISSFGYSLYITIYNLIRNNNSFSVYFESAAVVLFLIQLGKYFESKALAKTSSSISSLLSKTPKDVIRIINEKEEKTAIDKVNVNDILLLKPNENVAVDGIIIDGTCSIDESIINGESIPKDKNINVLVYAGTTNKSGIVKYKALKVGKDTLVSNIVKKVEDATNSKAKIETITDKVASYFTKVVLTIAIISYCVWLFATNFNFDKALNIFATILVIACPCSLGLATPTAIIVGSGVGARNGILFKDAQAIENSSKIKTICFDKTGTLTKGKLQVTDIIDIDPSYFDYIYNVEKNSNHPIAKGIVEYINKYKVKDLEVKNYKDSIGNGVSGIIGNKIINIYKASLSKKYNDLIDKYSGCSVVVIEIDSKEIGAFVLEDEIKDDATTLISYLHTNNIKTILISGDNKSVTKKIANKLNIDEYYSEVNPIDKGALIDTLNKNNDIAMVGDGVNDAIALSKASLSISFSNGSDIAINSSSIILTSSNILDIINALELSKKTYKHIKQNLFFAFFYNSIGISLAIAGLLNPLVGSLGMSLSSISVVSNALRINKFRKYKGE